MFNGLSPAQVRMAIIQELVELTIATFITIQYTDIVGTNLKIYRIGKGDDTGNASTEFDVSKKQITPMGGFVRKWYIPVWRTVRLT